MRPSRPLLVIAAVVLSLAATACGGGDDDGAAAAPAGERTVRIEMRDIAFQPKALEVEKGETIRFVFTNKGKVVHDAFVGDTAAQADHEKEMQAAMTGGTDAMGDMAGMGHGSHGEGDEAAISVAPGKTGELTHTFHEAGSFEIGCHQPGHYAGGMKVGVTVA